MLLINGAGGGFSDGGPANPSTAMEDDRSILDGQAAVAAARKMIFESKRT
jgi:hypothetical protein